MSSASDDNATFFGLVGSMYAVSDFMELVWKDRPLSRPQIELVAARVSAVNECFVEAAATVGIFNGLVRVADATGIPLDETSLAATAGFRETLGLNDFGGARNTPRDQNPL